MDKRTGTDIFLMVSAHLSTLLLTTKQTRPVWQWQVISHMASLFSRITGLSSFPFQILQHDNNNQELGGEGASSLQYPFKPFDKDLWCQPTVIYQMFAHTHPVIAVPQLPSSMSYYQLASFTCRDYIVLTLSVLKWWHKCKFFTLSKLLKVLYIFFC